MSRKRKDHRLWAVVFWLCLWQAAAMAVGHEVLLASPVRTVLRWAELAATAAFWRSILYTLWHILAGYSLAATAGIALGALSRRLQPVRELLSPLMSAIKSIPVASFVIAALIWIPSRGLSILISFLIAFPVFYAGTLNGLDQIDRKNMEMARTLGMPRWNRLRALVLPAALPAIRTAASLAIGLSWKSGVAAEVIGIPIGSIGEKLYKAKIYLATADLFAWTLTIIALSACTEKLIHWGLKALGRRLERV